MTRLFKLHFGLNNYDVDQSEPTLDSMQEETHKGKYMEHIEKIYMEYIKNI